jgi:anti-sigma regulatory factor (Ser/Thr protein kinase)
VSELRPAPVSGTAVECAIDIGSLAAARQAVERFARAHGLAGEGLSDLVLAANELAINAVRHGGGRGTMRIWYDGESVWCQVRDEGPGMPDAIASRGRTPDPPSHTALEGRGLWLVRSMTATTIIETGPEGTTVTIAARA